MEYSRSFKGIAFSTVSLLRRLGVYYNLWRVQEFHARVSNSRSALIGCRNVSCIYPTIKTESTSTIMIKFSKMIFKAEKISTQPISKNCEAEICKEEIDYVDTEGIDSGTFDSICDLVRLQQWDLLKEKSAKLTPSIVVQALAVKHATAGSKLQLFHLLEKEGNIQETLQIYSAMIHILIRAKMFSDARALMDRLILSSKCHASASDIFRSLISTYVGFSVPVALDMLIKTYARFNMIQDATDIFQQSSNCTFANDVIFCNRFLKVIIKMQLPDLVFKIFKVMQKRRICPNIDTWNCVLESYCEKGNLPKANNFVFKMHQTGTVPDGVTYDLLIDGFCKESRITEALELMKYMILHESFVPGIKAYSALIRGLCKEGNLQEADSLLQQIHQNGVKPSPEIYAALVEAHLRHWRICSAIKLHEQMLEHDLLLDKPTYRSIITIICNFEMVEETSNLVLQTMERELVPAKTIFAAMLKSNYLKDNVEQLKRILNKAMEKGIELSIATYTTLIEGFYKGGMLQEANEWFKEMQKRGLTPKRSSYVKLIYGHCKEGNSRIGLKLLEEMIQKGFSPTISVYEKIVTGLCVDNKIHEALNLAHQMLKRGLILEINTYARVIHRHLQEGNIQEVVVLMEESLKKGIILKSEILKFFTQLCMQRETEKADNLFHIMVDNGFISMVSDYNLLIDGYCNEGRMKKALELQDKMVRNGMTPDIDSFKLLIRGHCRQGETETGERLLNSMLERGLSPIVSIYNDLIIGYCQAGKMEAALRLRDSMSLNGVEPNVDTYNALIGGVFSIV